MNYLTLENVSKSYGDKVLFDQINLQIGKGEKVALVAKNGTGKTTLMRIIAGQEAGEGESSQVWMRKDIRIGFLEQEPEFRDGQTIIEAVFESPNEMIQAIRAYEQAMLRPEEAEAMQAALVRMDDLKAWDFEARIKEILSKLNIRDLDRTVAILSGGQRKRLALAKILIEEPEFIILDEPTNHLDLDMIEWLEEYLSRSTLTVFMVTHDRYFLERVCDLIVELDGGQLYRYRGNYSEFLEKKTTRHENEAVELDKTRKLLRKELEWVRRMPKARGTKAKSRVDKFYEIKEKASRKIEKQEIQIDMKSSRLGSKILEAQYINKSFGDLKIVDNFFYKFKKKERVGIVGPNGVGKTTFIKLLTKEIRPDSGKVIVGGTVVFGHYTQEGIQLLEDKRVIDVIRDIAEYIPLEKGAKLTAPQLLERFMFSRKHQQVYVSQLSGGEKRRLKLLTVLMQNPNFLILDEPTNDLDIITLNVLEEFLMDFPGCLLVVTHDRYFMDKLVDHLFIFEGNGKIKDYNGRYSEYRDKKRANELETQRQERAERKAREKVSREKEAKATSGGLTYEQRKQMGRLEKEIGKLEKKKAALIEQFNDASLTPEQIEQLSIELGALNKTLEEKEMAWLELGELE
ncbi:MAG: ABC-F family ATP-binding cassette domain-containing protein [Bacteroidota bacterium]